MRYEDYFDSALTSNELNRIYSRFKYAPDGCLHWQGAVSSGYGVVTIRSRSWYLHRLIHLLAYGELDPDLDVDHLCHTQGCKKPALCSIMACEDGGHCHHARCGHPAHLKQGTHRENVLRGNSFAAFNAIKVQCENGHPFKEENTYEYPLDSPNVGKRGCRACNRNRDRHRYPEKYAKEKLTWTHTSEMRDFNADRKLDWDKIDAIKLLSMQGWSQRSLGRKFEVSQVLIGKILRGECWKPENRI